MPPVRTIKFGEISTAACNQVIDDSFINNLSDMAASMRERGDTVICASGSRWKDSEHAVLLGQRDGDPFTLYPQISLEWRFENAGYERFMLDFKYKLESQAHNPGNNMGLYSRLLVQHTDKNGVTVDLWDSETASPAPTRGSDQTETITGIFADPPSNSTTEIEVLTITAFSNQANPNDALTTTAYTGFLSLCLKLYDTVS